jgi:hypothetical protein
MLEVFRCGLCGLGGVLSKVLRKTGEQYGTTEFTVFDVEPFGHELPSGLSLRVEDKAEWLRRNERYSVFSNRISFNGNNR